MNNPSPKTNIVILTDCLAGLTGGAERQIFELTKGLNKEKYKIFIASLECAGQAPRPTIESTGCELVLFPVKRIYGISGITEGQRFLRFLRQEKIDILMTYHFSSDIWGTFFGHIAGVKTIISNRRDMGFWRKWWHVLAYKLVNRWVLKIIVNAKAIKEMVAATEGVPENKIEVIYNGIDTMVTSSATKCGETSPLCGGHQSPGHRGANLRKKLNLSDDDLVIMHVANLKPIKGHEYLLKALATIVPEFPAVKLVLIGADELNGTLQTLAGKLGIAHNVLFLGQREDARDLLKIADICVLPSLSEGMSNAILEYMAAGKPVIATNVGGNPELISESVNGLLVPPKDPESLAKTLRLLLKDESLRKTMGLAGQKLAQEHFSLLTMVKRYETFFNKLQLNSTSSI